MRLSEPHRAGRLWKFCSTITLLTLLASCSSFESGETQQAKPMVYEGMAVEELKQVLGEPDSTSQGGTIYDVEAGNKKALYRWYYEKRTVVVIDDTVKVPSETQRK